MVRSQTISITIAVILLLLWGAGALAATNFSPIDKLPEPLQESMALRVLDIDEHTASYQLKVYVVEDSSRWDDSDGDYYDYGFLGFPIQQTVDLTYWDTVEINAVFDGNQYGYGDITEENISVFGVVFGRDGHWADAYPPNGYWFTAYQVQTTVKAKPGETGYDNHSGGYSHTVFIEEGTATW